MPLRRAMLLGAAPGLFLPGNSFAQNAAFVGSWDDPIVKITITGLRPNGQAEGTINIPSQKYVSTFADKADRDRRTALAVVKGSALTIDTAIGGKFELKLEGNLLMGTYTFNSNTWPIAFKRR